MTPAESQDALDEYRRKRDFEQTPEPVGGGPTPGQYPIFVVQKHDATRLHYDFRLEAGGVLVSWAVPNGPSPDPSEKRLAVMTEDHPMDYADFEGVIPSGYGEGPVIVWDRGVYMNLTERRGRKISVEKAVEHGHVKVLLLGEKLKGTYALTRTGADDNPKNWLMVKVRDEYADPDLDLTGSFPKSVISGKTIEEMAADPEGVWHSNRE